jgi:hypothetical protein
MARSSSSGNGAHTLNNVTTSGPGTFQISTENVGADASVVLNGGTHTSVFLLSGSTLSGTDHTLQGRSHVDRRNDHRAGHGQHHVRQYAGHHRPEYKDAVGAGVM